MEDKDLRIGNWYESTKWKKPVICTMEDMHELVFRADGAAVDAEIIETVFKTIELNEKWMDKFGFEKKISKGVNSIGEEIVDVYWENESEFTIHSNKNGFCICVELWVGIAAIKYVHELQTLFYALTGKELEFKKNG